MHQCLSLACGRGQRVRETMDEAARAAGACPPVEWDKRAYLAGAATLIQAGTSLVISDQGFGRETGKGTDFIVLTH